MPEGSTVSLCMLGEESRPKLFLLRIILLPLLLASFMISILAAIFPHNRAGRNIEIQRSLSGLRRKEVTRRFPASDAIGRQQRDSLSVRSNSIQN